MDASARIGPNAITQVAAALEAALGAPTQRLVFESAKLEHHLSVPPAAMIDEADVIRLHRALREQLGPGRARDIARDAGRRTGEYLLANRIPAPAQALLRRTPARLASRALLAGIRGHAWTFAGSGAFTAEAGRPTRLAIADSPLCRGVHSEDPVCDYYSATFERLFRELVHPDVRVAELACGAQGAEACRFEARW